MTSKIYHLKIYLETTAAETSRENSLLTNTYVVKETDNVPSRLLPIYQWPISISTNIAIFVIEEAQRYKESKKRVRYCSLDITNRVLH